MATSGQKIQLSSFSTGWEREYSFKPTASTDSYKYLYVCAPCWYLVVHCNYAIFGGSGIFQIEPYYWNGSSWIDCGRQETKGSGSATTHHYAHNRYEVANPPTNSWNNKYPLWKIRYWSSRNNANGTMTMYAGSWGLAKDERNGSSYYYPQNKKIFSSGRREGIVHDPGYEDDSNVLTNIFNPSNRRGSLILASNDAELICAPYLDSSY